MNERHGPKGPADEPHETPHGDTSSPDGPAPTPEHGPDPDGPDIPRQDRAASATSDTAPSELDLRRMFQDSVRGLEPSPEALTQIRRAVPARRARKRQALVGAAAAVLLCGTAVPALVHAGVMNGGSDDRPANAAPSDPSHREDDDQTGKGDHDSSPPPKHSDSGGKGDGGRDGDTGGKPSPTQGGNAGTGDSNGTYGAKAPSCGREQLGQGTGQSGVPDGNGRVYGTFRVVNVSSESCTVDGTGQVGASPIGQADASRIRVSDSSEAAGLPRSSSTLTLRPGQSYVVKFAWVPDEGGCPTSTPDPGDTGADNGGTGQPESQDDSGGSISVTHIPAAGDPAAASTVVNNACAGVVYRTGMSLG
ncbi:hypothetical protein [Streptomyces sp. NPDC005438]|uniref:hypothetical protein n=1 Tax=Streptomyces sp. NPDC005438 TaxID=3156880 RepID=UPI0033ABAA9C